MIGWFVIWDNDLGRDADLGVVPNEKWVSMSVFKCDDILGVTARRDKILFQILIRVARGQAAAGYRFLQLQLFSTLFCAYSLCNLNFFEIFSRQKNPCGPAASLTRIQVITKFKQTPRPCF